MKICHFEHNVNLTAAKRDVCISVSSFSYYGKKIHVCKFAAVSPLNCRSLFDYIRPLNISCVGVWKRRVYLHEWVLFSEVGNSPLRSMPVMHTKIRHHLSAAWCPGPNPSHVSFLGKTSPAFMLFSSSLSLFHSLWFWRQPCIHASCAHADHYMYRGRWLWKVYLWKVHREFQNGRGNSVHKTLEQWTGGNVSHF